MYLYHCTKKNIIMLDPILTPSISCFINIYLAINCFNSGITCFDYGLCNTR